MIFFLFTLSLFFCSWFSYSATLLCSCSVARSVCVCCSAAAALVQCNAVEERRKTGITLRSRHRQRVSARDFSFSNNFELENPKILKFNIIFVMTRLKNPSVNLVLPAGSGCLVTFVGPAGRIRRLGRLGQTKTAKSVGPLTGLPCKIA